MIHIPLHEIYFFIRQSIHKFFVVFSNYGSRACPFNGDLQDGYRPKLNNTKNAGYYFIEKCKIVINCEFKHKLIRDAMKSDTADLL